MECGRHPFPWAPLGHETLILAPQRHRKPLVTVHPMHLKGHEVRASCHRHGTEEATGRGPGRVGLAACAEEREVGHWLALVLSSVPVKNDKWDGAPGTGDTMMLQTPTGEMQ